MPAVSVLHSPRDEALGEKIADALARQGHKTRCLGEDPLSGDLMLEDGAAIVIWSNATAKLARLHVQAREALERGALIPVTVGGARAPTGFETLQPVDLSGWGGDENDPRWRFVLEEISLASQRARLADGSVWAPAQEGPDKDVESAVAAEAPMGDLGASEPESIAYEIDETPSTAENDSVAWDIDPPASVSVEEEAAPISVEARYEISAEQYWPETPAPTRKPVRFRARHVVLGGGVGLFGLTIAALLFAPAVFSPAPVAQAPLDATPSIAFVQPVETPEATTSGVAPKAQSDFEVTSYRDADAAEAASAELRVADVLAENESGVEPRDTPADIEAQGDTDISPDIELAALAAPADAGVATDGVDAMETLVAEAIGETPVLASLPQDVTDRIQLGNYFSDCDICPDMAALPAGSFRMGSPPGEQVRADTEGPVTDISLAQPFAIATHEVTYDQWQACADEGGCRGYIPSDLGWGRGNRPVTNVSYEDALAYITWLSSKTGHDYRLPSEAEWEFAARAGGTAAFSFGAGVSPNNANYNGNYPYLGDKGEFRGRTTPVGSFAPNNFGLYDMHGNVWEWTADCWTPDHGGAPVDGAAVKTAACTAHVIKGGAWNTGGWRLRAAHRLDKAVGARENDIGFRVARAVK
ncbi:Formylglycine-generating enzyme (FGE) (C-alpha-formylglycine-generating enzyme 1) (Sulfatase-modifying factor 1) [Durusdinium trenchii]|uniref:Formylglycine-generating enzyme (FGE) (C-alpha-formylglycine-generating enzyme 1) (Sulfatase-modifying factor 1) n=1 Tax=Durusdinium trenchii TaxID=1381693 RepID=A0ABP0LRT1_9DINO